MRTRGALGIAVMLIDNGDYKLAEVAFGAAERRLIVRYHAMLVRVADGRWVSPARFHFAAASAVECLSHGRRDAALLRRAGATPGEIAAGRAVARDDARFYLELALSWIDQAHLRAA